MAWDGKEGGSLLLRASGTVTVNGTIVLDVPKPTEPPPSAIDIIRHEQQTAPPCPILNNVPCLGKVLHGDPSGGGPSPF